MPATDAGYRDRTMPPLADTLAPPAARDGAEVAELVERLATFPFEPLPLPVNVAFGRQFGADAPGLVLGNNRRFATPHRFPRTWQDRTLTGHGGTPLAATVSMQDGPAPVLVLCHGLCMTRRFRSLISLARHAADRWGWHVVAYDARGCGQSAWLGQDQPTGGYLEGEDLVAIARALRRDSRVLAVHAVGISLGGSSVLNGARAESEARAAGALPSLDSVVSVSGPTELGAAIEHISTAPAVRDDFWVLFQGFRLAIRMNSRRLGLPRTVSTWRCATDQWLAPHTGVEPEEFRTRASAVGFADRIAIPTLHLHAEDDFCVPVAQAHVLDEAARDNGNVQVWVQPRGNHAAFDAVARRWYRSVLRRWCEHWTPATAVGRDA